MNYDRLKGSIIPINVYSYMVAAMPKYGIDNNNRVAHFIGQVMHESAKFTATVENLNYSAEGLRKIFPKYFPTNEMALQYARQPQKIASRVYGNRMGNGDEASGEGYKFRGRGYIMTTGKDNYKATGTALLIDFTANPDLLSTPQYASLSASWFFSKNGLNAVADLGITDEIITKITKRINGGTIGLADRIKHTKEVYKLLTA